ncbi:MAG: prephenate dehydratase [Fimbriimonadaceae bacterium]|nr:prephenate dehydratase [Fimbriimonadaceae bacterium]
MSLADLRRQLNHLDDQIIALLKQRAEVAVAVGEVKRAEGLPFFDPERERWILDRIANSDLGKFPRQSAVSVFREVIAGCLNLQQPRTVAFLGPLGTFTDIAARNVFGASASYLPQPDFRSIFEAVRRKWADHALVPVENSTAGTIREVLDLLAEYRLTIQSEHYFDIHHCLLSRAPQLPRVNTVYSKDVALDQCRHWLRTNLPNAAQVPVNSTADGVKRALDEPNAAAIGPELASAVYGIPALAVNIEDRADNRTRFFALGPEPPAPTGSDKTSLLLALSHQPGTLVQALGILGESGLNMTLIESRPSPVAPFEYVFFIDVEGHLQDEQVQQALAAIESVTLSAKVLGSYPKAV